MRIKVVNKPQVTDLAGEKVMVDFASGKYYLLKGVANDIWDLMIDGVTVDDIVNSLLKEYEVEECICRNEVDVFLKQMAEYNFIQLVE